MATITEREAGQIEAANAGGRTPVVFIHGLWLLAGSWERWATLFEEAGYAPVAADWPGDPATVEEARANPQALAGNGVAKVADHMAEVIGALNKKPAVVGHSFGGLMRRTSPGAASPPPRSRSTRPRSKACCRCRSRRMRATLPVSSEPA